MKYHVAITDIPIFKFMPVEVLNEMSRRCEVRVLEKEKPLVKYGAFMPGLFLVLDGCIEVCTENFSEIIATLGPGASVGEMSLIDADPKASASLRAGPEGAKLVKCNREIFEQFILSNELHASAFYKGLSVLLSQRLRSTNLLFGKKIEEVKDSIKEILDGQDVLKRLSDMRVSVESMGEGIVSTLCDALTGLEGFMKAHSDLDVSELKKLKIVVEKIMLEDLQNIDRVSQKLGLIWQFLDNVRRTVCNEDLAQIKGDAQLFKKE